jgi:Cu(I)/Ag(I) efflux system membrane fusion protein
MIRHAKTCHRLAVLLLVLAAGLTACGPRATDQAVTTPPGSESPSHRVRYYRNPMGLADTSPVPKKDSMGMDYVPVYADEPQVAGQVRISADRLQKLSVRTAPAARRALDRALHLSGTLQADESRQWAVSPRFEGWIERLQVATTGAAVHRGDTLATVYAPDVVAARDEIRIAEANRDAVAGADAETRTRADGLVAGSRLRLRNWGVVDGDFVTTSGGRTLLALRAEHDGVVVEKTARIGMRFMPGDALYQLADLDRVWLVANVFEQDLGLVRTGMTAVATVSAYPGRTFTGRIAFVAPVLQPETRTVQVRIELPNADRALKPAMYASVDLAAGRTPPTLTVPDAAVIDSGTRRLVLVDRGGGAFEPRTVRTGVRGGGYTEILEGLVDGDPVVVDGNFMIDSESNLKAVVDAMASQQERRP